jgi:exonuclease VII small subunit
MIDVYRDSGVITDALEHLAASETEIAAYAESHLLALRQEQATVRRSIDRYFAAFEEGSMSPATCQKRIEALESQLDALIAEEHSLETQEQASAPPSPETVAEWAKNLDVLLRSGSAQQRKALIRKLIKELRVMSRDEILPTYRIPALVRAPGHQVDLRGVEPLTSPVRECGGAYGHLRACT